MRLGEGREDTNLLVLPLGGKEAALGLGLSRERHGHDDGGEVFDGRGIAAVSGVSENEARRKGDGERVVVGVGVLALRQSVNEVELLLGESDVLLVKLVLDGRPAKRTQSAGRSLREDEAKRTILRRHPRLPRGTCRAHRPSQDA